MKKEVKKSTQKKNFYYLVLLELKINTNLTRIQEKLNISKQKLNYYLRKLRDNEYIIKQGRGWWELTDKGKNSKNSTQYETNLKTDLTRGHAYIWNIKLPQETLGWKKRVEILRKNKINFKLVGAMGNIPRIKVYGRKVWLCNNHLRVFEKKDKSYYGEDAKESKSKAFKEIKDVVGALENKLGINLRPYLISVRREHYALIKNDLAKHCNKNGEIVRISDKDGEWLLIDDSLEMGGEMENIGKKAFKTHGVMKPWWNDHKKHNFKVTPSFILETMNGIQQNQLVFDANMMSHLEVLENIGKAITELRNEIRK